jgi:ribonuclease HI
LGNGKSGARAGLGVYYGFNGQAEECGISERVPGELQTNNRGELLVSFLSRREDKEIKLIYQSVIRALEECPYPNLPLEVRTDSQYTIGCMTTWLPAWINKNFNGVKNADMIKHMLVLLRRRGADNKVKFVYVPGHSGEIGNDGADVSPCLCFVSCRIED